MMRVLVCGGRCFNDEDLLNYTLNAVLKKHGDDLIVVHGAAKGADLMAEEWAKKAEVPYMGCPARWRKLGRAAGHERNARMLKWARPDAVIAFNGGSGTAGMVRQSKSAEIQVWDLRGEIGSPVDEVSA